jgi:hypothetical protein
MDFNTWISIGREHGFCSVPVCSTHDGIPMSDYETQLWDDGEDPCMHILRLYESEEQMDAVEPNVPIWRQ